MRALKYGTVKIAIAQYRMSGFITDMAVYKELDQFSVNYFLLRGAEEEKAMVRDEMEGVILIQNYDIHCLRQSYKLCIQFLDIFVGG